MRIEFAIVGMIGAVIAAVPDADWQETDQFVPATEWKTCFNDADCSEGFACVQGLWKVEGEEAQTGSFTGCNTIDVCKGTGLWNWRANEVFQVFCSNEMKEKAAAMPDPEGLTVADTPLASEWKAVCFENSDCSAGQGCYPFFSRYDDSNLDYDNGAVCMDLVQECEEDGNIMFAVKNANYGSTGSEFDISYKCKPWSVGYSGASAIAATLIAALAAISLF